MARPRPAARHTAGDPTSIPGQGPRTAARHNKARPPKLESRSKSVGAETGAESPGVRYINTDKQTFQSLLGRRTRTRL